MKLFNSLFLILAGHMCIVTAVTAQEIDVAGIYHDYCSVCHGDKGDGRSHAMAGMVPPPRDFTSPESAVELTRERIVAAITYGVPGSAMTPWNSRLSTSEIDALADYVRTKFLRPATVASATEGSQIYADFCSVCHGDTGRGAVWATSGLRPPPIDFTSTAAQQELDRARMIKSVSFGRAETAMTGWKNRLTDQQIETVVDYVITNFMSDSKAEQTMAANADVTSESTKADMSQPLPHNLIGDVQRGSAIYMGNCSACHGVTGDGRGPRAYFINPKPRNFLHTSSRASFNLPELYEAVAKGKLRTEMPAWEKVLNRQQIADVSAFVFEQYIQQK